MLIKNMIVNEKVDCTLAIVEANIKEASNGPYLHMILTDKEQNKIEGKIWRYSNGNVPPSGLVVDITAIVGEYNGKKDLNIKTISHNQTVKMEEFLGYDEEKINKIYDCVLDIISKVKNTQLKEVAMYIMNKHNHQLKYAVGAKSVHHNYVGGYLTHIYEVTCAAISLHRIANMMGANCDEDMIVVGAILHDLGKLESYVIDGLHIDSSTPGVLIDHMALSLMMINDAYNDLKLKKDEDYYRLLHIIQSHHGCKEWGSPVEPRTIEAQIIHFADNFSAKVEIMKNELNKCEKEWTEKCWSLGGIKLFKGI